METLTKKRGEEGFTLIELLIVIVILGILAAIVVFAVGTTGKNSAAAACKADAKSVEVAVEAYKAQSTATPPAYPPAPLAQASTDPGWAALVNPGPNGAPLLRAVPSPTHYLIWWDDSGNVYATGAAGPYGGAPAAQNVDTAQPNPCDAVS
jgi:prepilin-type N-terminal cleavage/methylation domain-containing protein